MATPVQPGRRISQGWPISGQLNFVDNVLNPRTGITTPAYGTIDLGARYQFKLGGSSATLRARIGNLTDVDEWMAMRSETMTRVNRRAFRRQTADTGFCAIGSLKSNVGHMVIAAGAAYAVLGATLIIALVTVPLMRNTLYGGTTLDGAIALMGLLVALPLGGIAGGYLVAVAGFRGTAMLGIGLAIVGVLWMHGWKDVITSYEMWPALLFVGFGLGLCDAPLVGTVVENAREEQRAAATGMILVLWTVGMVIGLALLGSRGLGRFEDRAANLFAEQGLTVGSPEYLAAIHTTYEEVLLVTAIALVVALVAALGLRRGERPVSKWMRVPGVL